MLKLISSIKENKLTYLANIMFTVIFMVPFLWAISTSLKLPQNITKLPPRWIPNILSFKNYHTIWNINDGIFSTYFMNSIIITACTVLLVVSISAFAGYGFSKLKIPFKSVFFIMILATLMVPFQALLIPLYSIMKNLGLLNTRMALIITYITFQLPFGVFMLTNSFNAIPDSIRESALIDGAGEIRTFFKVLLPLIFPGIATVAIYAAYTTWNDFIIALVLTTSNEIRTLTVGLNNLAVGDYGTSWGLLTSGSIVSFIPMILLYVFLQRYFISGLTSGAVKS